MPFESRAQQRFLYAHPEKVGGKEALKEWSDATDFSSLPARKGKKFQHAQKVRSSDK